MNLIDEVRSVLPDKEEIAKKEREEQLSNEQSFKESFVKKMKRIIILDAKKGREHAGSILGRMIFTKEILADDSVDGYDWYGEYCPPVLEKFSKKRSYRLLKRHSFAYCKLIPSPQIISAYEHLKRWAINENVALSELYIYDTNNNEEIRAKDLEFEDFMISVTRESVRRTLYDSGGSPVGKAEYYYAVNYKVTVN